MEEQEGQEERLRKVLVVGGTGGVGRHVVRTLVERGTYDTVRVLSRRPDQAKATLAGLGDEAQLEVVQGDLTQNKGLVEATQGIDAIICASGGSGLGGNSPKQVDYVGLSHLITAAKANGVRTLVLVSSAGITQTMMGLSMNLFAGNYAKWKKKGEEVVRRSGLDYTIARPTWLTDDDQTLIAPEIGQGDTFSVMKTRVNRSMVAQACCACLDHRDLVGNLTFELVGASGEDKATDQQPADWRRLFSGLSRASS